MSLLDSAAVSYFLAVFNRPKPLTAQLIGLWTPRLRMSPEDCCEALIRARYLESADVPRTLEAVFSKVELAGLCRDAGASTAGAKTKLVAQLVAAAPGEAERIASAYRVFARTPVGDIRVQVFFEAQQVAYVNAFAAALGRIAAGDYRGAVAGAKAYDASRFFSGYPEALRVGDDAIAEAALKRMCKPDFARRYQVDPRLEQSTKLAAVAMLLLGSMPADVYGQSD